MSNKPGIGYPIVKIPVEYCVSQPKSRTVIIALEDFKLSIVILYAERSQMIRIGGPLIGNKLDTDWQGRLDNDIEINVQQKSFFSEFLYDQ